MSNNDHMEYKNGNFQCHACGVKKSVKFPIQVSEYTLEMKKFINQHGKCKSGGKHEEKRD